MNRDLIYLLFIFTITCYSQSNKFYQKTFTKKDGLALDIINTMCFDNDGFLWLGGNHLDSRTIILSNKKLTLQRFNGHSFHSIPLPNLEEEIINVSNFYKRKDGKFYINVRVTSGLVLLLFDPVTIHYDVVKFYNTYKADGISKVFNYKNKNYVISQKEREITLNVLSNDLKVTPLFNFTSTENKFLVENASVFIPFDEYCFIGDDNFPITAIDWNGNIIKRYFPDSFARIRDKNSQKFWLDETFKYNGNYYGFISKNPILHTIDSKNNNVSPLSNLKIESEHLRAYNDNFGNAVVLSSKGNTVYCNTFEGNGFKQILKVTFGKVTGINVTSKNINNDLWLATNNELHYFQFPKKTIKTYLDDYSIRTIKAIDSVNYLVSTETKGWFTLNTETDEVLPYVITDNKKKILPLSTRNIIIEKDILWSSSNENVLKIDRASREAKTYRHYPIVCMEKINDSSIIYGTNNYHLMHFNTLTKEHQSLVKTDSLFIYDIEVQNDLVINGTNKGLLTYNLSSKKHQHYNSKEYLQDPFILMTDYHKDYGYLLGTRSGYIIAFNSENNSFKTLYKDKLQAGIATILFDEDLWWINTFNGIVAFNPIDKTTTRFSEKDGFSHYESNRYSALKSKNGLFVGMIKGLNYFNPKSLKGQNSNASLELLKVRYFNKTKKEFVNYYNRNHFNNNYSISLPTENRTLDIDFALKNTNSVNKDYTFKYRINDKNWIMLNDKNTIQFPNLASGDYTLEIEADDFSGNKIGDTLILKINSKEFFYKTWWFFTLVTLIAISFLLWLLNQARIRKKLQEQFSQGLIQSQEDERKRIARELHDSISQQLTLIKKKAQNTNQEEITVLTNNTLEEVRAISRGLYPPLLKQLGLSESIEQTILEVDEQTHLFVSGDVDEIDRFFNEEQTLNCYRFIQECINNCLKHAEAKALSVSVLKEHNTIKITIQDNGKGFDVINAQKKNSLGLKTIYERIRILKGELILDSKPKKGTTIIAKIPINNA